MRVGFVVPRFGAQVAGGAETGARSLAEQLAARGDEVEVFTTCALDMWTWADELDPGTTVENGVTVHRFESESGRFPDFDQWGTPFMARASQLTREEGLEWIRRQGPVCPAANHAAVESPAEVLVYYPYLYAPAVHGVALDPARSVLHPAAHDEPALRLRVVIDMLEAVAGLFFQTFYEQALVQAHARIGATRQLVVGLGVEPADGEADAARAAVGLGEEPYILCLGRVEPGKGVVALARFFEEYKRRHPGPLRLVMAGPLTDLAPSGSEIDLPGQVDDATKWGLLRGAVAHVSPSAFESFSLVTVEAWAAGTPVMVNARCGPTSELVMRSGGGLSYGSYLEFEASLERLVGDDRLRGTLGGRGSAFAAANFAWPVVIDRYRRFLEQVATAEGAVA